MQVVLNFSHTDRDRALKLLRWIGELGGAKGHDLLLSFNMESERRRNFVEMVEEASKHFDKVETFTPYDEDERGWPWSPNHAWRHVVYWIRERVGKDWLWLEPDAVILKSGAFDAIAAEWRVALRNKKFFMGCDVDVPGSKRHMSGIAVYHAKVAAFTRRLPEVSAEAWDMFFAEEFLPFVHFTPLIQHVHHDPNHPETHKEGPTFSDVASLSIIRPEAVIWHRCKDGSLIERLREKIGACQSGLMVSAAATAQESGSVVDIAAPSNVRPGGSNPPAPNQSELDALRAELAEMKRLLEVKNASAPSAAKTIIKLNPKHKKDKPMRTDEEQAKINERMAKARAGRKVAA